MIRSFIGLPLPDHVADRLEDLQEGLPIARAVPRENLHLTLVFLDAQPEPVLQDLCETLSEMKSPAFDLRLSGLTVLGRRESGAIAVEAKGGEALSALQARVSRRAEMAGIELERRRFRPHVTIFRLPKRAETEAQAKIQRWIDGAAGFEAIMFRVDRFALFRSILSKHGAVYDELCEFPLTAPGE